MLNYFEIVDISLFCCFTFVPICLCLFIGKNVYKIQAICLKWKFVKIWNIKNTHRHLGYFFAIPFKDLQSWIHLNFQVASLVSRSVNDSAVTTVEIIFNPSLKLIKRLLYVELILEITTVSIWMVKNQIFILHLYHKEPDQTNK